MSETEGVEFDLKTLIFLNILTNAVTVITVVLLWLPHRKRFPGLGYWVLNVVFQFVALVLILLRGRFPDVLSIWASNVLAQAGTLAILWGFRAFLGRRLLFWPEAVTLAAFAGAFAWFALVHPSLVVRDALLSLGLAWWFGHLAWLLLSHPRGALTSILRWPAALAVAFVVVDVVRVASIVLRPYPTPDFYAAAQREAPFLMAYLVLGLLFNISLVLVVSQRLLDEVVRQEEKFTKASRQAPYTVIVTRATDGTILEVNDAFSEVTGFSREEAVGQSTLALRLWESDDDRTAFVDRVQREGRVRNQEVHFRRRSGDPLVGLISAELIAFGDELCIMSSIADITLQSTFRAQLEDWATHDPLTGLPNRRLVQDRFLVAAAQADRYQRHVAVLSLDLDRFKTVNDTWGHEAGDKVLIEASRRLAACLRSGDTVARYGGDEFVLVVGDLGGPGDALIAAAKLHECFQQPFLVQGQPREVFASLGVALYPDHGATLEDLLKRSDRALYDVKGQGRNAFRVSN